MNFEQILKQSESEKYKYPDVFNDNVGLDIVMKDKGLHAVPSWGYNELNKKRRATLEINTFRGISCDAIHYYPKVVIQGVNMAHDNDPNMCTMICSDDSPLAHYTYELKLQRPITQAEINDDPDRWEYYSAGELTKCFDTIEDILALAKEVFKQRFNGDWEFYVDSPYKMYNGRLDINK